MSADDVPAGWYRRSGEPGMLTWWDGSHWTDRRTPIPGGPLDPAAVIRPVTDEGQLAGAVGDDDDRPGENSGPIPVVVDGSIDDSGDAVFADPTSVFAPVGPEAWSSTAGEADPVAEYETAPARDERGRPRLWLVLLPLFLIALAAGALLATSGSDDDGDSDATTNTEDADDVVTIAEAVEVAQEDGLPVDLAASTVGSLIDDICDSAGTSGAETSLAIRIAQLPITADQVNPLLNALGKGAAVRCPDAIAGDSGLLLRTGELAIDSLGTTATTLPTVTTEVAAPPVTTETTTGATTATTRRPTTATTRAPAPTTPPPPPTTVAPTTTAACNANYAKCLRGSGPFSCAGSQGVNPDWKPYQAGATTVSGPFNVTGSDVFDLDVNGNGVACE